MTYYLTKKVIYGSVAAARISGHSLYSNFASKIRLVYFGDTLLLERDIPVWQLAKPTAL
jgi:hypothetical protein